MLVVALLHADDDEFLECGRQCVMASYYIFIPEATEGLNDSRFPSVETCALSGSTEMPE